MNLEKKNSFSKEVDSTLESLFDENSLEEDLDLQGNKVQYSENTEALNENDKAGSSVFTNETSQKDNISVQKTDAGSNCEAYSLDNLNAILLSLEWEITGELVDKYLSEIKLLKGCVPYERYSDYFLKILESLGLYIKKNLLNANPETVSMMQSVHQGLDMIFMKPDLVEKERKALFYNEYNKYLKFKKKIGSRKVVEKKSLKHPVSKNENFAESFALKISEAVQSVIREELQKIKHEIIEALKEK